MEPKRRKKPEPDSTAEGVPARRLEAPHPPQETVTPRRKASSTPAGSGPLSAEQLSAAFASLTGAAESPTQRTDETSADSASPQPGSEEHAEQAFPGPEGSVHSLEALPIDTGDVTPLGIIEAVFFTGDPGEAVLDSERIASLIRGVEPQEVEGFVDTLNEQYQQESRPYRIVSQQGGYRMNLLEEFSRVRDRFYGRVREARLSQAAVEVLAAVAYNQPITSDQIKELRGTASGAVLNQLVRRKLLRVERTDEKPKKTEYYVTQRFLDLFGLASLGDLPRSEDLNQK